MTSNPPKRDDGTWEYPAETRRGDVRGEGPCRKREWGNNDAAVAWRKLGRKLKRTRRRGLYGR
jgi:hypothetical protein